MHKIKGELLRVLRLRDHRLQLKGVKQTGGEVAFHL